MNPEAKANFTGVATPWHAMAVSDVARRLSTNTGTGLDAAEATRRLQKYGPNRLPEGKKQGPLVRFLSQFNNILVYVLLAAGFAKLMLNLWIDAAIILGVVVLNALLGFIQEGKAEKALNSIRNMLPAAARTLRGGDPRMIPAEQLVPGDVVLLESGDKVPADLRLIEVKNLRTEEAALTGESVPADKNTGPVSAKATVGDRENMAFSGTMVVSGRAMGVAVATGSDTELGRINQLLASVSALETPLLRQIKTFGYAITAVIAIVSVLIFAYGRWVKGMDFVDIFQAVIGIAVSVIPEGLPALITITLAIGVQRMAQRNAIIRRLPAVETLGSVSRICSDKTGTLTLMEMMVVSAVTAESEYQVTGDGYAPEGKVEQNGQPAGKTDLVLDSWVASRSFATMRSSPRRMAFGAWRAIRPKERSTRLRPNSGRTGKPNGPLTHGSTPFRSSRSTNSWRRSIRRRTARKCCWSRGRQRSFSRTVTGSKPRRPKHRSLETISRRLQTGSRAKASACSGSLGSRIPGSRLAISPRPICRPILCCSA